MFASVDGGGRWVQLKGGMPPVQMRDMALQKRDNDLVLGTFGRGFWVLDDYSALRECRRSRWAEPAQLYPLRDAYLIDRRSANGRRPSHVGGGESASRRRVHLQRRAAWPAGNRLVLNIADETGRPVARLNGLQQAGFRRPVWNLRADGPPCAETEAGAEDGA